MKRIALTAFMLSSVWPVVHAQTTIDRVRMTDNDLTCQQTYSEIGQMDGVITRSRQPAAPIAPQADPNAGQNAAVAGAVAGAVAQTAITNAAVRGGFGFGGFGGMGGVGSLFGSLVQQAASQNAQQAAAEQAAAAAGAQQNALQAQQAQGRKDHLTSLFLSRGCKMSEIQKQG